MVETPQLIRAYLRGVRCLSGAVAVSLFAPPRAGAGLRALLVHEGSPPVPELANADAAGEFVARTSVPEAHDDGDRLPAVLPTGSDECCVIPLPGADTPWVARGEPGSAREREPRRSSGNEAEPPSAWLGLRCEPGDAPARRVIAARLSGSDDDPPVLWSWLLALGGIIARHAAQVAAVHTDAVTGLSDRTAFQAVLAEEFEKARAGSHPLSVLLLNPDQFGAINERFGREAGDRIVQDISARLRLALRQSDTVSRYGGVIFSVILADTPADASRRVADKVLRWLSEAAYLDGSVRLAFSIGLATFDAESPAFRHPVDLTRRADQALNAAKRRGGGQVVEWQRRMETEETRNFDRVAGVFTGKAARDYRNMALLWEVMDAIAGTPDSTTLAARVVERIFATLKPERLGLFLRQAEADRFELLRGMTRSTARLGLQSRVETAEFDRGGHDLMTLACRAGLPQEARDPAPEGGRAEPERFRVAVPMIAGTDALGCLLFECAAAASDLDASDLVFLKALGSQLALALDRARLAERESLRHEQQQRRLREELRGLRHALQQSKMLHRSPRMGELIERARRVALTDATILITGESGTGKELLARTVHELSRRSAKPFAVVDCGAIATSLIESELFGHERGAFTGADDRRAGRLEQADGGTLLLDEIGELPLEVQSKLLRFVQDKLFTTVGGTSMRRVDVRILAATNRDLSVEVEQGRFREDLYHRLNVVRLHIPPLRERTEDVLHLAHHFFEAFVVQYHKNILRLTPEAETRLVQYAWPGNVRELQNRMMQAVILCEGEELGPGDLALPVDEGADAGLDPAAWLEPPAAPRRPGAEHDRRDAGSDVWLRLRSALGHEIDSTLARSRHDLAPLGRWLRDDLLQEADAAGEGVLRRASGILGVPETTFRRRRKKIADGAGNGSGRRSISWGAVRQVLSELVRSGGRNGRSLQDRIEETLLEEIVRRLPDDVRSGSALLGVTPPTFRRRLERLHGERSAATF